MFVGPCRGLQSRGVGLAPCAAQWGAVLGLSLLPPSCPCSPFATATFGEPSWPLLRAQLLQPLRAAQTVPWATSKAPFYEILPASVFLFCFVLSPLEQILTLACPEDHKRFSTDKKRESSTCCRRTNSFSSNSKPSAKKYPSAGWRQRCISGCSHSAGHLLLTFDNYHLPGAAALVGGWLSIAVHYRHCWRRTALLRSLRAELQPAPTLSQLHSSLLPQSTNPISLQFWAGGSTRLTQCALPPPCVGTTAREQLCVLLGFPSTVIFRGARHSISRSHFEIFF